MNTSLVDWTSGSLAIDGQIVRLQCIQRTESGLRCVGQLGSGASPSSLVCEACHETYPVVQGVAVMKTFEQESLTAMLDESVYRNKSRTASLAGKDLYLSQSQGMIDYLAAMAKRGFLHSPSLEVGCGLGIFADHAPGYVGLDYSLAALLVEGFEGYRRICASGDALPFQTQSFRTIFSLNTLEHVPELDQCFEELDRVLMPGGVLVLKPAWSCMQYNCDGVGYFPYSELSWPNRVIKYLLPVIGSKAYKALTRIPWRIHRHVTGAKDRKLAWSRLRPRFDLIFKVADAEAYAQIDPYECIRWFTARGYTCISHPRLAQKLSAGHDYVSLVKPM
jgi:SAM-dependent methyltransferase/uncharacterized protein YbaR (Trm112 family)